ncbi:unnamed protein product [Caenorhabditis auriculariae]|uniref:Uncharacterized protein n=1 Tax=Caenorhabditis auriculariae TaxID=2777116 RepID=A0A8S1HSQ0_9PELO|nr:unnamed protein product [Caenorhabditis auriculariae]
MGPTKYLRRGLAQMTCVVLLACSAAADYCGANKVPYGLEVHRDGRLNLLCSRPNCHEKKYAECPERETTSRCLSNSSWVGGLTQHTDGGILLRCCEYDLLPKYGKLQYSELKIRKGEFFEGEEKLAKNNEDVIAFDIITDIEQKRDLKGVYYSLTVTHEAVALLAMTQDLPCHSTGSSVIIFGFRLLHISLPFFCWALL